MKCKKGKTIRTITKQEEEADVFFLASPYNRTISTGNLAAATYDLATKFRWSKHM